MASKKPKKRQVVDLAEAPAAPVPQPSPLVWLERRALLVSLLLTLFASMRIVATYSVFNHTSDEPNHIACGMEWLDKGTYTFETQHPPLARVAAALGPYLLGVRLQPEAVVPDTASVAVEGTQILYAGGHYDRSLALARAGILPFFWIACLVVYWWGRRYFDGAVAAIAVLLFSFLQVILAHAGLATTDMALTAFVGAAFVGALVWVDEPSPRHAVQFGGFTALAILSKLSAPIFLAAAFVGALAWYVVSEKPKAGGLLAASRRRLPSLGIAMAAGFVLIWAGYRFSLGPLPAPQLWSGIKTVLKHNSEGHPSYLLGERSAHGFWDFYPVVLAVKTPLAFLALLGIGVPLVLRRAGAYQRAWIPLSFALAILAVGMGSNINIGARHILPVYMAFSLIAAVAVVHLWKSSRERRWAGVVVGLLLVWYTGGSLASHPDYLAYFNALGGSEPEKILVDSNLDWGQDMKRLAARLHEVGARELTFNPLFIADLEKQHGFPPIREMDVLNPSPGWNAVSVTSWKLARLGLWATYPQLTLWPDRIAPRERVGKTILLWYFPYPNERPAR